MKRNKYKNIMMWPEENKNRLYARIHRLWEDGATIETHEHKSGFPAITVDVETENAHIHVITDVVSAEQWRPEVYLVVPASKLPY
jgi:hypothetical protein